MRGNRIDYVYVKFQISEKKTSQTKRVKIPNMFYKFLNTCKTLFADVGAVRALYDRDGVLIRDLKALEPGTTVIAASQGLNGEIDFADHDADGPQALRFDPAAPLPFANYPDAIPSPAARAPECLVVVSKEARGEAAGPRKPRKRAVAIVGTRRRVVNEEEDRDEEEDSDCGYYFFDQTSNAAIDQGISIASRSILSSSQSLVRVLAKKSPEELVAELIALLLPGKLISEKTIKRALQLLDEADKDFVAQSNPEAEEQRHAWVAGFVGGLEKRGFTEMPKKMYMADVMDEFARRMMRENRFMTNEICAHRFGLAIVGPPKCGKSTMMSLIARQTAVELSASDEWKRTFVLVVNMKELVPLLATFQTFYKAFVTLLIEQVEQQNSSVVKWGVEMRRYFGNLLEDGTAPIQLDQRCIVHMTQKNLRRDLQRLGDDVVEGWKSGSVNWWMTSVMNLAIALPVVLGFRKTMFIVDNFEFADVAIAPMKPFIGQSCFFCEHMKYVLAKSDYIISCQSTALLYQSLLPVDREGVDLMKNTRFVSMNGMFAGTIEGESPLIMRILDDEMPLIVKREHCDGIPNYLLLWSDLNRLIDEVDEENLEPEHADASYFAVAHAQLLVNLLFCTDNEDVRPGYPQITSVRRASPDECMAIADSEAEAERAAINQMEAMRHREMYDEYTEEHVTEEQFNEEPVQEEEAE